MYEILRVPYNEDQFMKAYDYMKSYCGTALKMEFPEFYKKVKSIYMIADKCYYHGVGYIAHKEYTDLEMPAIFKPYRNHIFTLDIITFNDDDLYNKTYDLIRTIIKDCLDRMIVVENIPAKLNGVINALKNNKFKKVKNDNTYTQTWYYIPTNLNIDERLMRDINPRESLHTIDKMNDFCCDDHIATAQEQYTKDLMEKVRGDLVYTCSEPPKQTIKEFLGEDNCMCCKCGCKPCICRDTPDFDSEW